MPQDSWFHYYRRFWLMRKRASKNAAAFLESLFEIIATLALSIQGLLRAPFAASIPTTYANVLLWLGLAAVVFAFFSSRFKKKLAAVDKDREGIFLSNISELQGELERTVLEGGSSEQEDNVRLEQFGRALLRLFFTTLNVKAGLGVNVMIPNEKKDVLFIWLTFGTGSTGDLGYRPKPDQGVAGIAFKERLPVYVPDIRKRHGLLLNVPKVPGQKLTYGVVADAYVPRLDAKVPNRYRSVLSVPIMPSTIRGREDGKSEEPEGVLNFDSPGRDPFDEVDFKMAAFFAHVLWMSLREVGARKYLGVKEGA
jgi:hypothetical protein